MQQLVYHAREYLEGLRGRPVVADCAVALELCTLTWQQEQAVRVHMHAYIRAHKANTLDLELLSFQGTRGAHVSEASAGIGDSRVATTKASAACYYVCAPKLGHICHYTTSQPHVDFQVKDAWITKLYATGKLTVGDATQEYLLAVSGAERNIRQLQYVEMRRKEQDELARRAKAMEVVASASSPFREISTVSDWLRTFDTVQDRYKFLVLDGPSCMGKTRFAKSFAAPGRALYCDCSNSNPPDLRSFSVLNYDVVILDEMAAHDAIKYKKLLQASMDVCKLGCSPTQQHAYDVYVSGIRFVIATNTWRSDLSRMIMQDVEWLTKNSVYVLVTSPLWVDDKASSSASSMPLLPVADR